MQEVLAPQDLGSLNDRAIRFRSHHPSKQHDVLHHREVTPGLDVYRMGERQSLIQVTINGETYRILTEATVAGHVEVWMESDSEGSLYASPTNSN